MLNVSPNDDYDISATRERNAVAQRIETGFVIWLYQRKSLAIFADGALVIFTRVEDSCVCSSFCFPAFSRLKSNSKRRPTKAQIGVTGSVVKDV
jgi:hypothetical protein